MISPVLKARLRPLAQRQRRLDLWKRLAICWLLCAGVGLAVLTLQELGGWSSSLALPLVFAAGVIAAAVTVVRHRRQRDNWRELARQIEARHPELNGVLLTAVQQTPDPRRGLGFLQERVLFEALQKAGQSRWITIVPRSRILLAQAGQWAALAVFGFALWTLRPAPEVKFALVRADSGVTVTPGDVSLERGSSLVVMARFGQAPPSGAELVLADVAGETTRRVPLVKSLDDPIFGGTVPEVTGDLLYRVEFGREQTRDFKVTVFEYPKLERSDVDIRFPEFTGQPAKRLENTRRVSAVEGSLLDVNLQLNKPVAAARLVSRDTNRAELALVVETNQPAARLSGFALLASRTYDLQLVDADGRTNKVPAPFVFEALKNRAPELRITSPRGDTRPSPLEELVFEGTVWDDFGIAAYGLAYTLAGGETVEVPLGTTVAARERRAFRHVLALEELGVQTDDLLSWHVWAEDRGPDGALRRTTSDLFFAEVRAFDEIFREGQGMAGGEQGGEEGQAGGEQGSPSARLADLQKQIINATWRLLREKGSAPARARESAPSAEAGANPRSETRSPGETRAPSLENAKPERTVRRELNSSRGRPPRPVVFGQAAPGAVPRGGRPREGRNAEPPRVNLAEDAGVVRDSQAAALDQAQAARDRAQDPRAAALWEAAAQQMERALARLKAAPDSPEALREALAAEQAAYQALLKLQEREYAVSRSRNRQPSGGNQSGRQRQMQPQLDQLELTQSEDRYETQRQARAPQSAERREQLQVLNRLQELARRQQDVNERLQELQTALQAARTEQEREEIRRELKRLQEEQQQMIEDADELRQRMDRPENQSQMADQRQQLEQTRQEMQRAAEAAREGAVSQALAAGTRAQRQMQEMRDQLRRESAGEFGEDLRQMREAARELTRQQAGIQRQLDELAGGERRSLTDADRREELLRQLEAQKARLTNLVAQVTQLSEQTEQAEPLVSTELYDALRRFSQSDAGTAKDLQEELLNRGLLTQRLLNRLQETERSEGARALEVTAEMLRQGYLPQADQAEERARAGIAELTRGIERAAERVLGDDAEALRLAREQLDELTREVEREAAQARAGESPGRPRDGATVPGETTGIDPTPADEQRAAGASREALAGESSASPGERPPTGDPDEAAEAGQRGGRGDRGERTARAAGREPDDSSEESRPSSATPEAPEQSGPSGGGRRAGERAADAGGDESASPSEDVPRRQRDGQDRDSAPPRGEPRAADGRDGRRGGPARSLLDQFLEGWAGAPTGPITGEDFAPWADRLREVEELVGLPELRTEIARARERARQLRQDFRRSGQRPDWAVVRLEVVRPLVEVRDRIAEELARRDPGDKLVPIDRDPVPSRYSELVRRYYEELGRDR
ncbi:MAG: hypothetical protein IPM17_06045 [Verrucomicrobia bacterium]|nr:hypothetical protein [Verrucomicrobiota bacterium]